MSDAYSRHLPPMLCNLTPELFWRIFQIVEYKILVQYVFPEIPQEILNFQELPDTWEFQIFHVYSGCDWSSDVCSSDLYILENSPDA